MEQELAEAQAFIDLRRLLHERRFESQPVVIDPRLGTIQFGKAAFSPECSALFRARRELAGGRIPEGVPCDKCERPTSAYLVEREPFIHHFVCRRCGHHFFETGRTSR